MLATQSAAPAADLTTADPAARSFTTGGLRLVPELSQLLPQVTLKRGICVGIAGQSGSTSLLLRLIAGPMATGSWVAVIGFPDLGIEAASELGVVLDHFALIPDPGPNWLEVTAALIDAVDIVVLNPPSRCRPTDARRLLARARQRHSVLVLAEPHSEQHSAQSSKWPEQPDLIFEATANQWHGIRSGHGTLRGCSTSVTTGGRRLNGPRGSGQVQSGQSRVFKAGDAP